MDFQAETEALFTELREVQAKIHKLRMAKTRNDAWETRILGLCRREEDLYNKLEDRGVYPGLED